MVNFQDAPDKVIEADKAKKNLFQQHMKCGSKIDKKRLERDGKQQGVTQQQVV